VTTLLRRRANVSRRSGSWSETDFEGAALLDRQDV
jgi:hypothetical protein